MNYNSFFEKTTSSYSICFEKSHGETFGIIKKILLKEIECYHHSNNKPFSSPTSSPSGRLTMMEEVIE